MLTWKRPGRIVVGEYTIRVADCNTNRLNILLWSNGTWQLNWTVWTNGQLITGKGAGHRSTMQFLPDGIFPGFWFPGTVYSWYGYLAPYVKEPIDAAHAKVVKILSWFQINDVLLTAGELNIQSISKRVINQIPWQHIGFATVSGLTHAFHDIRNRGRICFIAFQSNPVCCWGFQNPVVRFVKCLKPDIICSVQQTGNRIIAIRLKRIYV